MSIAPVDAWLQHPTPAFVKLPMFATLRRWMGMSDDSIPDTIPLEMTLGAMDVAGVERGLISAWHGPTGPIIDNREVAEHVEASGGRLIGVASVDLSRPMEAVRELRHWASAGFKGLRVLPWLWRLPPNDRRYYPLYAACVDLGLVFCTQVGHTGPLAPSEMGRPIPYIDDVALDFPELTIVGGHIGYPWTEEMVALATKYDNVYIDTSAYKPKRYPRALVEMMRGHGRRKVLWGTNYPMILPQAALDGVDALGLDDEARELFLRGNTLRVFGLAGLERQSL